MQSVLGLVQSILSRITILSNLEQKEIISLIDFLADTLARDLMVNRLAYGIVDVSVRDKIYFNTLAQAFICLKRAFEEGDRRFLKGSSQEINTRVETSNMSGGFLKGLLGFGSKK